MIPPWYKSTQARATAEVFGQDSELAKRGQEGISSWNIPAISTTDGTCNLSEIFKQMAMKVLTYWAPPSMKIQVVMDWDLMNWNASKLCSDDLYPKGLKFLHVVPPSESPKVMGLMGIHDPDAIHHFSGITHCPLVWEGRSEWGDQWSITYRQCTTGWALCATDVIMPVHQTHWTSLHHHGWQECQQTWEENPQWISFICSNHQQKTGRTNLQWPGILKRGVKTVMVSMLGCPC